MGGGKYGSIKVGAKDTVNTDWRSKGLYPQRFDDINSASDTESFGLTMGRK